MTQMGNKARIILRGKNCIYCTTLILLFTKRSVKKINVIECCLLIK